MKLYSAELTVTMKVTVYVDAESEDQALARVACGDWRCDDMITPVRVGRNHEPPRNLRFELERPR